MADRRKEQEREELHRAIWSIADDLREGLPAETPFDEETYRRDSKLPD